MFHTFSAEAFPFHYFPVSRVIPSLIFQWYSSACQHVGCSSGSHLDHRHSPGQTRPDVTSYHKCHDVPRCGAELLQCISMSQAIFQQWPEFLMSLQREAEITHLAIGCTDADLLTRGTPSFLYGLLKVCCCFRSCTLCQLTWMFKVVPGCASLYRISQ